MLEDESVLERLEDRLDALADPGKRRAAVRLVSAGGAQDRRGEALLGLLLEVAAGIAPLSATTSSPPCKPRSNSRSATSRSF
jgi:hypothetical protein